MERNFKGVWIPAEIWLDARLTLVEKALYAEIDSFTGNEKTFHKTNETIQSEYGISRPTVSKSIKNLKSLGYIQATFDGRMRHLTVQADRKIFTGRGKDFYEQQEKNLRAEGKNSTSTNTSKRTKNNTSKKEGVVMPFDSKEFAEAWDPYGLQNAANDEPKNTPSEENKPPSINYRTIHKGTRPRPSKSYTKASPTDGKGCSH